MHHAGAGGGQGEAAGVESAEGNFKAFADLVHHVLDWYFNIVEMQHAVVQRFESHEAAAGDDFDSWRIHGDDECRGGEAFAFLRGACHDNDVRGLEAVGAPELLAIQNVVCAGFVQFRVGLHLRRIGADVLLS